MSGAAASCRRTLMAVRSTLVRAAVVAAVALGALPAAAAEAARNGKIAFVSDRGYATEIYVMDPDGGRVTPLTTRLSGQELAWSPDGRTLLVYSIGPFDLFRIGSDGSDLRVFLAGWMMHFVPAFSWSPDGSRIAFAGYCIAPGCTPTGVDQIQVMNADTSGIHTLTAAPPQRDAASPSWSPDGKRIVFVRYAAPIRGAAQIWTMNADGSGQTFITGGAAPSWSPDGNWIAFTRVVRMDADQPIWRVFVMHPDGSGVKQITRAKGKDYTPVWSPDGRGIAYSHDSGHGTSQIHIVRPDGTGDRDLTRNPSRNFAPAWQPVISSPPPTPPLVPAILVPTFKPRVLAASRHLRLNVRCRRTKIRCRGTLSLFRRSYSSNELALKGTAHFDVRARSTNRVDVKLLRPARALSGNLVTKLRCDGHNSWQGIFPRVVRKR